jgi:type I restriction enzyme S subunit
MPDEYKRWLLYWLRSPLGRQQIEALATGNQLSMRNLSQANLRAITVRLPSADERKEITRRVENLLMLADRLELRQKTAMSSVDRLTPALLAKAFRGELVPQNANDEPAAELLQRLIKERSGEGETTKRARGRRALTPCAE